MLQVATMKIEDFLRFGHESSSNTSACGAMKKRRLVVYLLSHFSRVVIGLWP
jgi:hypothetical protein